MKIGYSSEKLHHALQPLFLNINRQAQWYVGKRQWGSDWYILEAEGGFFLQPAGKEQQFFEELDGLRRYLFDFYREKESIFLPWGIISGIRPGKLARQIWQSQKEMSESEFMEILWQKKRISAPKAKILWQVLGAENQYLKQKSDSKRYHLYLGIPYCPSHCYYCSFAAGIVKEDDPKLENYLGLLEQELEILAPLLEKGLPASIYFGGGTPTVLSAEQLQRLFLALNRFIDTKKVAEFTVEAGRPDTISLEKLKVLKAFGVNRISINPQTFEDKTLKLIGRNHTVKESLEAFAMARELGFIINMDLIFGLKGEGMAEIKNALSRIKSLHPENITIHTLAPKRGADLSRDDQAQMDESSLEIEKMLDFWYQSMESEAWQPYYLYRQKNIYFENIGYALPGKECHYNMESMLEEDNLIAIGAGSISKRVKGGRIDRFDMPKQMEAYAMAIRRKAEAKRIFFEETEKPV